MNHSTQLQLLSPYGIRSELPLLVYLPGMDGSGRLFNLQGNLLVKDFDLRCLDIPKNNQDNWEDLSEVTIALIESELNGNSDRLVYLCGESFGGCLALKIAVSKPELVGRLILVNPASSFNQRPLLSWGINITAWTPEWLHSYSATALLPFLAQLDRIEKSDRNALIKAMKSLPPQIVSWRLSLLQNFQIEPSKLANLDVPSLIIAGKADRLLPSVEEARRLVRILPRAKMAILPHSGHACLLETETNLKSILKQRQFLPTKATNKV